MADKNCDKKVELAESFAIKIIDLEKYLREQKKERRMSDQIFRSATSIGANISEAKYAESTADYLHKLSISQKEANETLYWLRLLFKTGYIDDIKFGALYNDCQELLRVITNVILSVRRNQKK
ncbi:MAG: four helix bundle protein [Muribaculaceae bacterium]|nr:four helix bundle protein [Muribaculaceae bacterium]